MRKSITAFVLLLWTYAGQTQTTAYKVKSLDTISNRRIKSQTEICWFGTINNKIPVFLHYSFNGNLIAGEIVYLNTKDRKPIKVLGKVEEDKSYRLLEFESNGNISGIITGKPAKNTINGSWFSPKTRKELQLKLVTKDTVIETRSYQVNTNDLFGSYHYQYSTEGYQGDFEIKRLKDNKAEFNIISVTGAPGRNIAEVPIDTIKQTGSSFTYRIPDTDSCEFKVTFYKGFLNIDYTKGYCTGQFGLNATIDGIYLKVRR